MTPHQKCAALNVSYSTFLIHPFLFNDPYDNVGSLIRSWIASFNVVFAEIDVNFSLFSVSKTKTARSCKLTIYLFCFSR